VKAKLPRMEGGMEGKGDAYHYHLPILGTPDAAAAGTITIVS